MLQPNPSFSALTQADQELLELRMIPAPTLAVLRQELGLSDRDPLNQMTPAERQRLLGAYRQLRLQQPDHAQLRGLPQQQQRLKRSSATPEETYEVGRTDSPPSEKCQGPSPEQLSIEGIVSRMQNLQLKGAVLPQAMNPTIQGPPSNAIPGSSEHPGAPNSNMAHSLSPIPGVPMNPGPIANQQWVLADSLFPPDFMQHLSNSLDDFNTNMFPEETDINFERDFGQWFNGDDPSWT